MSDLSRLLDDVYGTASAPMGATEAADAFADWVPEPVPVEKAHLQVVADPAEVLEAILDLGLAERSAPEPLVAPVPVAIAHPWVATDDDILPINATRRRLTFRRR